MAKVAFKGNSVHTSGNLPELGAKAIDFKLVRGDLSEVTLQHYKGKKKVLNIVPSLDTGVCATSAKTFDKKLSENSNVVMLNISMDLPFAQDRFCKAEGINNSVTLSAFRSPFPDDYGVRMTEGPLEGLCARAILVIDEDDNITYKELVPEVTQEPDYDQALKHV